MSGAGWGRGMWPGVIPGGRGSGRAASGCRLAGRLALPGIVRRHFAHAPSPSQGGLNVVASACFAIGPAHRVRPGDRVPGPEPGRLRPGRLAGPGAEPANGAAEQPVRPGRARRWPMRCSRRWAGRAGWSRRPCWWSTCSWSVAGHCRTGPARRSGSRWCWWSPPRRSTGCRRRSGRARRSAAGDTSARWWRSSWSCTSATPDRSSSSPRPAYSACCSATRS